MNLNNFFAVPHAPDFLSMTQSTDGGLSLSLLNGAVSELSVRELFTDAPFTPVPAWPVANMSVNAMLNNVARTSRRGPGNLMFCSHHLIDQLDIAALPTMLDIVPITSIDANEVWVTYFKPSTQAHKAVDGPFAYFNRKLYLNPKWKSYLVKSLIPSDL